MFENIIQLIIFWVKYSRSNYVVRMFTGSSSCLKVSAFEYACHTVPYFGEIGAMRYHTLEYDA